LTRHRLLFSPVSRISWHQTQFSVQIPRKAAQGRARTGANIARAIKLFCQTWLQC